MKEREGEYTRLCSVLFCSQQFFRYYLELLNAESILTSTGNSQIIISVTK